MLGGLRVHAVNLPVLIPALPVAMSQSLWSAERACSQDPPRTHRTAAIQVTRDTELLVVLLQWISHVKSK